MRFGKISRNSWILIGIVALGIFLRTYHFHDWLLFGPDQARDASIIGDAITGKSGPILLGAQAGNTQFYLGPVYYQLGQLSGVLFGNFPDKFAYPDLLFSVLSILALFFLLKKYFSVKLSLFLSALFSVAYFSIYAARFAVNSNSLSFFVIMFLIGLLELMEAKSKHKTIWAVVVGISFGVGIQLHTLAFLAMPIVAIFACAYLIKQKNLTWKNFLLVLLFFLITNFGQLSYELKTGGANFGHFIKGAGSQSADLDGSVAKNVFLTEICQVRANVNQITALRDEKYCVRQFNFLRPFVNYKKADSLWFIIKIVLGILFALGGYILWCRKLFSKKLELGKKRFLALLMFFNLVFLGLFVSVVAQAEVHYFNFIFFVSFVLLGLWIDLFFELGWGAGKKKVVLVLLVATLILSNVYALVRDAKKYVSGKASDSEISILGEIIPLAKYLRENSNGFVKVYLDGDRISSHRFSGALSYLMDKSGGEIARWDESKKNENDPNLALFYIKLISADTEKTQTGDTIGGKKIKKFAQFGNIAVYVLENNL